MPRDAGVRAEVLALLVPLDLVDVREEAQVRGALEDRRLGRVVEVDEHVPDQDEVEVLHRAGLAVDHRLGTGSALDDEAHRGETSSLIIGLQQTA